MAEIGATLREARMRARIDVSEIEAQTKIRAKYLRALENEEWGLLPGPTFVKSFLRTYAQALGLDGKALVEEYRLHHERPSEAMLEPIVSTPAEQRARTRGRAAPAWRALARLRGRRRRRSDLLIVVLLIVLLVSGGGGPARGTSRRPEPRRHHATTSPRTKHTHTGARPHGARADARRLVALPLRPTALVYVCLIGDDGRKLIPGARAAAGRNHADLPRQAL